MLIRTATQRAPSPQSFLGANPNTGCRVPEPSGSLGLIGVPMPFNRDSEIFGEKEPADYVYRVLSGAVRTYRVLDDGRRQIAAFYLPGDLFGLEASDAHAYSAEAIGRSVVIVIKRSSVLGLAKRDPEVARQLWQLTASELRRSQNHIMQLVRSAPERIAAFLLEMAERSHDGDTVELPMSRQDIADYLGVTIETVSRTLTHFEQERTIELLSSRRIVLRNRSALTLLNA
jgi:CRP/FNR family transcriptional regulator, nitrogen fixation regulation protein